MGRVGRKTARVQVTSRLTWTFSATARLGRSRAAARSRLPVPASSAGRRVGLVLLRTALRAARPRPALPSSRARTGSTGSTGTVRSRRVRRR
ncbi:hypothetical protein ABT273_25320 [Streptomyces humidus]|uniref:hypothetical protein n=1 Tax=Streptomyces humidus TaxID=52259 RepID=UPI0033261B9E